MGRRGFISHNERRYMLVHVAVRVRGWRNRYEIDELVNEAWLSRHVRETQQRWKVFVAGRWAMLNYIRQEERRNRKVFFVSFKNLTDQEWYYHDPTTKDKYIFEYLDEVARLTRGFTRTQKLVFDMRMQGYTLKEIGRFVGNHTQQNAQQIWQRCLAILRLQYGLVYKDLNNF